MTQFAGSLVKFSTRDLVNGNRHFEGRLVGFSEGQLTVDLDQVAQPQKGQGAGSGRDRGAVLEC